MIHPTKCAILHRNRMHRAYLLNTLFVENFSYVLGVFPKM